jgi:hypothetical protein
MVKFNFWQFCLRLLAAVVGGAAVIILGHVAYLYYELFAPFQWEPLPQPREEIALIGADWNSAYVETADGKIYSVSDSSLREVTDADTAMHGFNWCDRLREPPRPPGVVIDSEVACLNTGEDIQQSNYILLEDGSLWIWTYYSSFMTMGIYPVMGVFILVSLLLFGLSIALWRWANTLSP